MALMYNATVRSTDAIMGAVMGLWVQMWQNGIMGDVRPELF